MEDLCQLCELAIRPLQQTSEEEIEKLKEHMDITQVCEECCIAALGKIEFPD